MSNTNSRIGVGTGAVELSRSQVEEVLVAMHSIAPQSRSALQARMRHFQRLGIPAGTNMGKGRRAAYAEDQVFQLAFAFAMLDLGLTPERIRTVIETDWSAMRAAVFEAAPFGPRRNVYLQVYPAALLPLKASTDASGMPAISAYAATFEEMEWQNLDGMALINVTALIYRLQDALTRIGEAIPAEEISAWRASVEADDVDP